MSVSIHWRPASDGGKSFAHGTSRDLDVLQKVFGSIIAVEDVPRLRAMAMVGSTDFFNEVADTVEKVGSITVWGVW